MLGAALDCHLGEMPVYQTTNCRRHRAQLENSSPAAEGISLLGGLAWGSVQGPRALAMEAALIWQPILCSEPWKGRLASEGSIYPSRTAGESWRSLIGLKEVLAVGEPGRHESASSVGTFSWSLRRRLVSPGMYFSAPATLLPPRSSVIFLDFSSLSLSCASDFGFLPLSSPFHLSPACCQWLSLLWIHSRFSPLAELRQACNSALKSLSFCVLILLREQERTCAQMNYFLQTYCN